MVFSREHKLFITEYYFGVEMKKLVIEKHDRQAIDFN
jgi:hypothetical protein